MYGFRASTFLPKSWRRTIGLSAGRLHAQEDSGDLVGRIAKARGPVRTIHGPFTQTRTIGLLATDVKSQGRMALVRPDRLRWDLEPPDAVTFWIGPEGVAYRSAHGQGTMDPGKLEGGGGRRLAGALDDMRILLGGDIHRLAERWSLRVLRDDATGAELEATARAGVTAGIRTMRFALAPDLVRPTRTVLIEGPKDHTTIEFGTLAINDAIAEADMRP